MLGAGPVDQLAAAGAAADAELVLPELDEPADPDPDDPDPDGPPLDDPARLSVR